MLAPRLALGPLTTISSQPLSCRNSARSACPGASVHPEQPVRLAQVGQHHHAAEILALAVEAFHDQHRHASLPGCPDAVGGVLDGEAFAARKSKDLQRPEIGVRRGFLDRSVLGAAGDVEQILPRRAEGGGRASTLERLVVVTMASFSPADFASRMSRATPRRKLTRPAATASM